MTAANIIRVEPTYDSSKIDSGTLETFCYDSMETAELIYTMVHAIKRITTDEVVTRLADKIINLSEALENEIDVIRESILKHGLIGHEPNLPKLKSVL